MSGCGAKCWHFDLKLGGLRRIAIVRGGREINNRQGKSMGPLTHISQPTTHKGCTQAENFLPYALQVTQ